MLRKEAQGIGGGQRHNASVPPCCGPINSGAGVMCTKRIGIIVEAVPSCTVLPVLLLSSKGETAAAYRHGGGTRAWQGTPSLGGGTLVISSGVFSVDGAIK